MKELQVANLFYFICWRLHTWHGTPKDWRLAVCREPMPKRNLSASLDCHDVEDMLPLKHLIEGSNKTSSNSSRRCSAHFLEHKPHTQLCCTHTSVFFAIALPFKSEKTRFSQHKMYRCIITARNTKFWASWRAQALRPFSAFPLPCAALQSHCDSHTYSSLFIIQRVYYSHSCECALNNVCKCVCERQEHDKHCRLLECSERPGESVWVPAAWLPGLD